MDQISLVLPCFNGGVQALAAVQAIGRLERPEGLGLEAIVVDDASTDGSSAMLSGSLPAWARVVVSGKNLGRGGAINLGAGAASGKWLLILDCDCTPASFEFLRAHMALLGAVADATVGDVHGYASGFWGRYQSVAGKRRAKAARAGSIHALTTANMMIRTEAFRSVGGFNTRYRHYGFEDRDFLLRLKGTGARIRHIENAAVVHNSNVDLAGICQKMQQSGRHSAPLFRDDHPAAYSELGYASIDAELHPRRARMLARLARAVLARANRIEYWLQQESLPYFLRATVARLAAALAYMEGTRANRSTG